MDIQSLDNISFQGDATCGEYQPIYSFGQGRCSLVLFRVSKPTTPHIHRVMNEVYFIKSGEGEIRVGDEYARVSPGDRVIIPRGHIHQALPIQGTLEMFVLTDPSFNPEDVIKYPDHYQGRSLTQFSPIPRP